MALKLKTLNPDLFVRRCVACGYDGALLNGSLIERCPRCGCDLRSRPPRSYAEMEGFIGQSIALDSPLPSRICAQQLIHRWLAFLFLVLLGFVLMAYLLAEAVP